MLRFLAACSAIRFWTCCANSEDSSNISDKKSEKFFSVTQYLKLSKIFKKPDGMHFLTPRRGYIKMSGTILFFHFFIRDLNKIYKK